MAAANAREPRTDQRKARRRFMASGLLPLIGAGVELFELGFFAVLHGFDGFGVGVELGVFEDVVEGLGADDGVPAHHGPAGGPAFDGAGDAVGEEDALGFLGGGFVGVGLHDDVVLADDAFDVGGGGDG